MEILTFGEDVSVDANAVNPSELRLRALLVSETAEGTAGTGLK